MTKVAGVKRLMLGGGGHARILLDELHHIGLSCNGIIDPNRKINTRIAGVPVVGNQESQSELQDASVINGVGMLPGRIARVVLARKMMEEGRDVEQVISDSSAVSPTASLHSGVQILARAVVNCDTVLGRDVVINTSAIIEHDVLIGDRTWISPGAIICGGVDIGEEVFVGAGAIVLQGIKIGSQAVIGAGTVVTKEVRASEKVVSDVGCKRTISA